MKDAMTAFDAVRWIYVAGLVAGSAAAAAGLLRVRRRTGLRPLTLLRRRDAGELARAALVVVHAVIYVAATYRPGAWPLRPVVPLSEALTGIGAVLYLGGIALYALAVRQMGASFRIGGDPGRETRLVDHGMYTRVRHPIYAVMLLSGTGAATMYPCPFTLASLPVAVVGFVLQARREERILLERLGDEYARYMERTGRLLPRLGGRGRRSGGRA